MEYAESWAVTYERAKEFWDSQGDVLPMGEGRYRFGSCAIRIDRQQDRRLGSATFPRTLLKIQGETQEAAEIYARFFLRFLSAGG